MEPIDFITIAILVSLITGAIVTNFSDNSYKRFVIKNKHLIEKVSDSNYRIPNLSGYHTEVTIRLMDENNSYTLIFRGDRCSLLWDFRKDKKIMLSIPYDSYKGRDTTIDEEMVNVILNKKYNLEQ